MADDDGGLFGKMLLTGVVVVLAIPGLIVEPGPLSELAALGALGYIWGFPGLADGGES